MDPLLWFLLLGIVGWALAGPKPTSRAVREAQRQARLTHQAARATCRAYRQAWRRRVFGSHPVLYGALFWISPVLLLALLALLTTP